MNKKNRTLLYKKPVIGQGLQTGMISAVLLVLIAVMIWNTSELHTVLEHSTIQYVKDVSYQQTMDFASRMETYQLSLEQIADSIPKLANDASINEFIDRKVKIIGFDSSVIIDREGTLIPKG